MLMFADAALLCCGDCTETTREDVQCRHVWDGEGGGMDADDTQVPEGEGPFGEVLLSDGRTPSGRGGLSSEGAAGATGWR